MTQVFARKDDGTEVDVTEGVKALYDLVINSMDWGSGFLTYEDALPVLHIAETMEFGDTDEVRKYVTDQHHSLEQQEFLRNTRPPGNITHWNAYTSIPHEHVFSSAGKCMWPRCYEVKS